MHRLGEFESVVTLDEIGVTPFVSRNPLKKAQRIYCVNLYNYLVHWRIQWYSFHRFVVS